MDSNATFCLHIFGLHAVYDNLATASLLLVNLNPIYSYWQTAKNRKENYIDKGW